MAKILAGRHRNVDGHEKSDSVIVAEKPVNKAAHSATEQSAVEPAAAELVEPRAETKGNAGQQSTCRAQSRVSVSQALERIRQVARERKKERFTALFHHISIDLLEEAFYELKEDAAPGVDRLTWTDYEADLERRLEDLHGGPHAGNAGSGTRPSHSARSVPAQIGPGRPSVHAALTSFAPARIRPSAFPCRSHPFSLLRRFRRANRDHAARLDLKDLPEAYSRRHAYPLVSISDDQRIPLASANWLATIHHGLAAGVYSFNKVPSDPYLAFLGRISPEKRPIGRSPSPSAWACASRLRQRWVRWTRPIFATR
jgi:hypothetical protein